MRAVLIVGLIWMGQIAQAVTCERIMHRASAFVVCTTPASADIRTVLNDASGKPFGHFDRVQKAFEPKKLRFAMNAGMYHADRRPVGLYIENGAQQSRLVTRAGPGNFGLLPNGVFCLQDDKAYVIESRRFKATQHACQFATQSGPMLVIDAKLHPRFLPNSTSRYVRNGVGVRKNGTEVVFAISSQRVTFHEFGTLFRDVLKTPNALYFDGNISRLHAPGIDRSDAGVTLGPIVGVFE